jgi:hypothetical protein
MGSLSRIVNELENSPNGKRASTDKGSLHTYLENFYEPLIGVLSEPNLIVEIGILHGASLAMWKNAFPRARVVGIDIALNENLHPEFARLLAEGKIEVLIEDAYSEKTFNCLPSNIDLLIDDGSHELVDQILVLNYRTKLSEKGVLVVEDVALGKKNFRKLEASLPNDSRNSILKLPLFMKSGRYDDYIFVWTRNELVLDFFSGRLSKIEKLWSTHVFIATLLSPIGYFNRLRRKFNRVRDFRSIY